MNPVCRWATMLIVCGWWIPQIWRGGSAYADETANETTDGTANGTTDGTTAVTGADRLGVLKELAARGEANYKKLKTWRATYDVVDTFPEQVFVAAAGTKTGGAAGRAGVAGHTPPEYKPEAAIVTHKAKFVLAVDFTSNQVSGQYEEDRKLLIAVKADNPEARLDVASPPENDYRTIVANDQKLTVDRSAGHGPIPSHPEDPSHIDASSHRLVKRSSFDQTEAEKFDTTEQLDPRRLFPSPGREFVWETLTYWIKILTGEAGEKVQETFEKRLEIAVQGVAPNREYTVSAWFRAYPITEQTVTGTPDAI